MDFESRELTLKVDDKQEKFKIYTNVENPLHEELSEKAKEECKYIVEEVQQDSKKTEPNLLGSFSQKLNKVFKVWWAKRECKAGNGKECKATGLHREPPWSFPPYSLAKNYKFSAYWEATQFSNPFIYFVFCVSLHVVLFLINMLH